MPEQPAGSTYRTARTAHWNQVAIRADRWAGLGGAYHRRLREIFGFLVAPGKRVLEVGCGTGDLLAALKPEVGVGVDFSEEMVTRARRRHPTLTFHRMDAHELDGLGDVLRDVGRLIGGLKRGDADDSGLGHNN